MLVLLPFWTGILVKSYSFIVFLGEDGLINHALVAAGLPKLPLIFNRVGEARCGNGSRLSARGRSSRRMPKPNTGDRNSHGSRVDEFRTAKLRLGSPDVCPGPGCGEDDRRLLRFQRVLTFEQSVNHRRGPRSWPQIGAAATWL
jgi:hypothetical protein